MTLPSAPSQARVLAQLKTRLGDFVVEGWEGRSGDELYQAIARVFSHLSLRTRFELLSAYLRRARGAARHRVEVVLTWSELTNWGYTIKAGQLLVQTRWGAKYRLIEDLVRAADAPAGSVTITVEAEWAGFEYFVAPGTICEFIYPVTADPQASILWSEDTSESGMDEFLTNIGGPPVGKFVDTPPVAVTLTVTNPTSGTVAPLGLPAIGATGFLDLLAIERGLPREEGESDDALRVRIRTLPDVVTPGAILRVMNAAYNALFAAVWPGEVPTDESVALWEPWNYGYAPGVGAIGVHPIARSHSFMVVIPSVPWLGIGYAPGVSAIGVHPIGTADMARAGYYAGLQNQLDRIRAGGIWGQIYEGEAPPISGPVYYAVAAGSNAFLYSDNHAGLSGTATLVFRFFVVSGGSGMQLIISDLGGLGIGALLLPTEFAVFAQGSIGIVAEPFAYNAWHHGALTYDADANARLFIDGVPIASAASPSDYISGLFYIFESGSVARTDLRVAGIRYFSRVLADAEIAGLANAPLAHDPVDPAPGWDGELALLSWSTDLLSRPLPLPSDLLSDEIQKAAASLGQTLITPAYLASYRLGITTHPLTDEAP